MELFWDESVTYEYNIHGRSGTNPLYCSSILGNKSVSWT